MKRFFDKVNNPLKLNKSGTQNIPTFRRAQQEGSEVAFIPINQGKFPIRLPPPEQKDFLRQSGRLEFTQRRPEPKLVTNRDLVRIEDIKKVKSTSILTLSAKEHFTTNKQVRNFIKRKQPKTKQITRGVAVKGIDTEFSLRVFVI